MKEREDIRGVRRDTEYRTRGQRTNTYVTEATGVYKEGTSSRGPKGSA